MNKVKSYKDLVVYQKALDLVVEIYKFTRCLPSEEKYGLVSQMRRAAVSIPSNIAEGFRRKGLGDYIRFLAISNGSLAELETQINLCRRLYSHNNGCERAARLLVEVKKMLCALIGVLAAK